AEGRTAGVHAGVPFPEPRVHRAARKAADRVDHSERRLEPVRVASHASRFRKLRKLALTFCVVLLLVGTNCAHKGGAALRVSWTSRAICATSAASDSEARSARRRRQSWTTRRLPLRRPATSCRWPSSRRSSRPYRGFVEIEIA